jgi:endogenous inhibitor of DNA gyrase (YacG/DUF329 family)
MPAKPPKDAGSSQGPVEDTGKPTGKSCPICSKPGIEASRPFCSERCRDVDLNRWLSNSYAIPAAKDDDEDAE